MQYYFVQSGITRSRQCATLAEADVEAREALQRPNESLEEERCQSLAQLQSIAQGVRSQNTTTREG